MATPRGNFHGIDQMQNSLLSGKLAAEQFVTTTMAAKIAGHVGAWDTDGNLIDGGTSSGAVGSTRVTVNGTPVSSDLDYTINATTLGFTINGA